MEKKKKSKPRGIMMDKTGGLKVKDKITTYQEESRYKTVC